MLVKEALTGQSFYTVLHGAIRDGCIKMKPSYWYAPLEFDRLFFFWNSSVARVGVNLL
jgi:hypothetical protein